jgi:hypothetical protein
MVKVSKKFADRAKTTLRRYQKVLESARARDVNESDTCVIISDFLADVLGYDKYGELTTEFAIRSTFCDLAIKVGGKVHFLIEVKSAGTELKDNHLRQAIDYAANQGVEWVLLTNGIIWQAHRLRFEQPIQSDQAFEIDLLSPDAKPTELLQRLYLISREAAGATDLDKFYRQKEATSRYVLAQLLLGGRSLTLLRRQLRQQFPGLRIEEAAIAELLRNDVIKRDAIEGEKATAAEKLIRRAERKRAKAKEAAPVPVPAYSPMVGTATVPSSSV